MAETKAPAQDEPRNEKIAIAVTATEKYKLEKLAKYRAIGIGPLLRTKTMQDLIAEYDLIMADAKAELQAASAGT